MDPNPSKSPASAGVTGEAPNAALGTNSDDKPATAAVESPPVASDLPVQSLKGNALRFEGPLLFAEKDVMFSQPHHSQDLIGLYGVTSTAAKLARIDPVTGEKINKLRSSYQNQIKAFQIAGRNKAIKHEEDLHGMSLREISAWPDEEWRNQKVATKEVSKGLSSTALAKLEKALKLEPGPVPKNDEWESILGHEKTKLGPSSPEQEGKLVALDRKSAKVNGYANGNSQLAGDPDGIRARRTGKRRRYDDDSFEGYGEGYVDDDRDDAEYSSDGGTKKKKRRKELGSIDSPVATGYNIGAQQQSIGRGIGAFGR